MLNKLIHRPISVTAVLFITIVLGVVSITRLPVSLIPDIEIPFITVQFNTPGLSARELSTGIVRTVCEQLIQTEGIENIEAKSNDGSATITLSFSHKTNMDYAIIEVNERIDKCIPNLGKLSRPTVSKSNASDIPAFYINLTLRPDSELDFNQLSECSKTIISKRLEQLNEVAMVDVSGYASTEIHITPDESKLHALGITQNQFNSAILQSDISFNSLSIKDGYYRYTVKFISKISSIKDLKNIRLRIDNSIYRLEDLAKIRTVSHKKLGTILSDGQQCISIAVIKNSDCKMSSLKVSVNKLLNDFKQQYPNIKFTITQDQTHLLEYTIENIIKNIIAGILIASFIIFLFMRDLRSSALVCLTMPLSLIFSMGIFYLIGLSLNIISLSGLLLGIGMLADNTIILIDNINTQITKGKTVSQAVIDGTKDIMGPMLSSVLTTCAVFLPLIFLSGIAGKLFYDQAMAITIVLLTSYIITISVIPVYYNWWFNKKRPFAHQIIDKQSDERLTLWFMNHSSFAWLILALSLVGIFLCFKYMDKEKLPTLTSTETIVGINWNEQISLEENTSRVKGIEKEINAYTNHITAQIGTQDFILKHSSHLSPNECEIYIACESPSQLAQAKNRISGHLAQNYPLCVSEFRVATNVLEAAISDLQANLVAKLYPIQDGNVEMSQIREITDRIQKANPSIDIPKIQSKQDIVLTARPDILSLYDISNSELVLCLKNALSENYLLSITQGTSNIPVIISGKESSIDDILSNTFIQKNDTSIPVSCLLEEKSIQDFKTIYSDAAGVYYPLEINIEGKKIPKIIKCIDKNTSQMNVRYSGAYFSNAKMIKDLILTLAIAIILLFLILACQFESFLQPLMILSEIGIDILFSLIVLWICGVSINLMSMIGLVVVCGIVINDSILKVDCINKLRINGMETKEAIIIASKRRKKAIIMTSLTTIFAILPFMKKGTMGSDLQFPLMLVIVVGLSIGTFVSLYILPALYYSIYGKKKK